MTARIIFYLPTLFANSSLKAFDLLAILSQIDAKIYNCSVEKCLTCFKLSSKSNTKELAERTKKLYHISLLSLSLILSVLSFIYLMWQKIIEKMRNTKAMAILLQTATIFYIVDKHQFSR